MGRIVAQLPNITLPYLRNTIVSVVVVLLMLYVQTGTIILVTTRGGPLGATETLSMRVYNQTFNHSTCPVRRADGHSALRRHSRRHSVST